MPEAVIIFALDVLGQIKPTPESWNQVFLKTDGKTLFAVIERNDLSQEIAREVPDNNPIIATNALRLYSLVPPERREPKAVAQKTLWLCLEIAFMAARHHQWRESQELKRFGDEVGINTVVRGIHPNKRSDELVTLIVRIGMYVPVPASVYFQAIGSGWTSLTQFNRVFKNALPDQQAS